MVLKGMEGFVLFVCACVQRCRAPLFGAKYGLLLFVFLCVMRLYTVPMF